MGYLEALAATARCQVLDPKVDDFGIDAILTRKGRHRYVRNPQIHVQMKTQGRPLFRDGAVLFDVDMRTYDLLRATDTVTPQLLVLLHVPATVPKTWIDWRPEEAALRHRAYWANLVGHEACANKTKRRIAIPTSQALDTATLVDLMERVQHESRLHD